MDFNYLNDKDLLYFSKHILLPNIGIEGQQKLNSSEVTVFGLGGIGNLITTYIASAGVKKINIVDFDTVEDSNLQRQINFTNSDIGFHKTDVIDKYLQSRFPNLSVNKFSNKILSTDEVDSITADSDIVLDGTDNFEVRKIINKSCNNNNKKLIIGAVEGYSGQLLTVMSNKSTCYECIYEDLTDNNSCSESGVLAPLVGMISSMMAMECINILTGNNPSYENKLILVDGLNISINIIKTKKKQNCLICSQPYEKI